MTLQPPPFHPVLAYRMHDQRHALVVLSRSHDGVGAGR